MAETPAVSPLLDGFTVGECISSHNGVCCYFLRHDASGQEFILKHISIPESEAKVQALLLSGAYANKEAANVYFKRVADSIAEELSLNKAFADCPYILHYLAHQTVAKEDGAGFDVYTVSDKAVSLKDYTAANALTKLRAINLGIDLCAALCTIRAAGYLFQNIKPENIFVENGRFMLGDLGLTALQDLKYSSLPEQYIGPYTAPELHDIMAGQNVTTDLYAVGMLLYRIYNGDHAPFEDERISAKEADRMRLTGKTLPVPMYADYELAGIILKACAFKPEERYQTPEEMKQELELYMQRNGIDDTLIVPPIVADSEPEPFDEQPEEDAGAPVRFADVTVMDEEFIKHFSPDTASLEAAIEQMKQEDAKEAARASAEQAPVPQEPAAKEPVPQEAAAEEPVPQEAAAEEPVPQEAAAEESVPQEPASSAEDTPAEQPEAAQGLTPIEDTGSSSLVIKGIEEAASEEPEEAQKTQIPAEDELPEGKADEAQNDTLRIIEDEHSAHPAGARHSRRMAAGAQNGAPGFAAAAGGKAKRPPHRKQAVRKAILGGLLVLIVAFVFIYFFTPLGQKIYHYTISIEQFDVTEVGASSISVYIGTNVEKPPIAVSCKDAYGNRFDTVLTDGTASFTGLESGTQYTITASLKEDAGLHRLAGTTTLSVSTQPSTELLVMTASAGSEEGAVAIDIVVKDGDPEPVSWTVSYCCEGGTSMERSFPGKDRSFFLTGLEVETEYTFSLVSSDLFTLTGETSVTYTTEKEVTAEKLHIKSLMDGVITVEWTCTSEPPALWTLTCTDPEGNELSTQTAQCEASVEGLQLGTPYTIKLSARGLFTPLSFELPENLVHIDRLALANEEDGLHVSWTSSGTPVDGNWILTCYAGGDKRTAVGYDTAENSIVLTDLLPDTTYTLVLHSSGKNPVVGHYFAEHTVEKPEHFDSRGIKEDNTKLATFAVPEKENWKMTDLGAGRTEFDAADKIAYKLNSRTGRFKGSFSLLYIIRDENGIPVDFGKAQYVWNEAWMWDNGADYGMVGTVEAPDRNGTFTLELYFSYDLEGYIRYKFVSASAPFTVTGAAEE